MTDPIDVADFTKVTKAVMNPATDARTVAIMAAAYIDDYLGMAVRTKLPGLNSPLKEKLFGTYGLFSSTAAKIDLARALDIISRNMMADLILINRIRNRFAHSICGIQ